MRPVYVVVKFNDSRLKDVKLPCKSKLMAVDIYNRLKSWDLFGNKKHQIKEMFIQDRKGGRVPRYGLKVSA